jgi:hypothetical protein
MEKRRIIDLQGSGGAFTPVYATKPIRRLRVVESLLTSLGAANVPQGLNYQVRNDGTPNGFTQLMATSSPSGAGDDLLETIQLGSDFSAHQGQGEWIGSGPTDIIGAGMQAGTQMINLRSATATPTSVTVIEYD